MSVIRTKKARDKPFVILDTTALNDQRLSFRAKGLHTYLMAKPDDWQVHIEQLEKQSPREARDAIRAALQELEVCGYIRRKRIRGEKGRMMGWDTTVYESPRLAEMDEADEALSTEIVGLKDGESPKTDYPTSVQPTSVCPTSDEPTSAQPSSGNPQLLSIDSTKDGEVPKIDSTHIPFPDASRAHASGTGEQVGSGSENLETIPPKSRRLPKSQQPGSLHPDTMATIRSMSVEAFHCLANPNKLNEVFWDAQITLIHKAGVRTFAQVIAAVDAYYASHDQKWPLSEAAARKRMGFGITYELERAQKHAQGRKPYA